MTKIACLALALGVSLVPAIADADRHRRGDSTAEFAATTTFASLKPSQQWLPQHGNQSDPRSTWGYGSLAGILLMADELGDKLSETGRASLVERCFDHPKADLGSTLLWAMCGADAMMLDLKKVEAELDADGVTGDRKAEIMNEATTALAEAKKVGETVLAAAKNDPGLQKFLKLTDDAQAEWKAYLGKHQADFDRYVALKDAVRTNKSNDPAFAGCFEATQPEFVKLVKATAPKIPFDVGNDQLPGYMTYLEATTEGYVATVAWAACAWSVDPAGEAVYAAAANRDHGALRAGWRTLALAKVLDPELKIKFADRSLSVDKWTFQWKYGVKMQGINDITAIQTPSMGEIATLKPKDDATAITFKGSQVEECLEWKDTNKVKSVDNGNVSYEKVCKKRGMVADQTTAVEVPTKYLKGTKVGDKITIIHKFPVVSWKGKKLTALLGVPL